MERRTIKEVEIIYSEQAEILMDAMKLSKDEFEKEGMKVIKVGDRTILEYIMYKAYEEKKKILKLAKPQIEVVK